MESPNGHGYLVTIILSASDNFLETKNLVNWICQSHDWYGGRKSFAKIKFSLSFHNIFIRFSEWK